MLRQLPIRWRLTGWYALFFVAAGGLLGIALFAGLRHVLYDNFNEQVQADARLAASGVRVEGSGLTVNPAVLESLEDSEHFIRLFDASGALILDTSSGIPMKQGDLETGLRGEEARSSMKAGDSTFVIATAPVRNGDQVIGVIQTGANRSDVEETLTALLIALSIAAPVMVVLAATGGYIVAGRVLQPVAQITALAGDISAADLQTRLNLDLPDDELGQLARTFDAMLARIEDAFERQRRFAGDAAHELRTPLTLMRSQVDLALARPRSAEAYQEALADLDRDLARMTGLVSTLLSLARSDAGLLKLELAAFDLAETTRLIAEQYTEAAEIVGIAVNVDVVATPIEADEDLLIQVLVNLLDNALAATPAGGAISLSCHPVNGGAWLRVSDNGSGIAPEHLDHIFDRFYRVDRGRSRERGGAGLGLSISQAIIEAHGGTITVASEIGTGSIFDVRLPPRARSAQTMTVR